MFTKPFDLGFTRSAKQAIGFYILWLILIGLLGGVVSAALFPFFSNETSNFEAGFRAGAKVGLKIGASFAIIADTMLAFWVLKSKKAFTFFNVLLAIITGVLSIFGGALLGLIPVAYLTTCSSASE